MYLEIKNKEKIYLTSKEEEQLKLALMNLSKDTKFIEFRGEIIGIYEIKGVFNTEREIFDKERELGLREPLAVRTEEIKKEGKKILQHIYSKEKMDFYRKVQKENKDKQLHEDNFNV